MEIKKITSYEDFLALEKPWNELVDNSPQHLFWLRHEQLRIWWEIFKDSSECGWNKELFILLVYDRELIAIAPLMKSFTKPFGLPLKIITFIGSGRSAFIIARDQEQVVDLLLDYLLREKHEWLELHLMPAESCQVEALEHAAAAKGLPFRIDASKRSHFHSYVPIKSSWETFANSLSKDFRKKLNKRERRLRELGEVKYEKLDGSENLVRIAQSLMQVEENSWKSVAGDQILHTTSGLLMDYAIKFLQEAAARGYLQLFFLWLNEVPVAYSITASYRNRLVGIWSSYDLRYAAYSPGSLLLRYRLQTCFAEGKDEYEFLSHHDYQTHWTRCVKQHETIKIYNNRAVSALDSLIFSRSKLYRQSTVGKMRELWS